MPRNQHSGSDLNLAWNTPPWAESSGETVDATDRDTGGSERTVGDPDLDVLADRRDDQDDRTAVDRADVLDAADAVIEAVGPAAALHRLRADVDEPPELSGR